MGGDSKGLSGSQGASRFLVWTARQRATLAVLVLVFCGYLMVRATLHTESVSDPSPVAGPLARTVASRIDPNSADWPALAALPLIGEKRAKDIVAWREEFLAGDPAGVPFETLEDLTKVKGIGKVTVEQLEPYLTFPNSNRPAARP